MDEFYLRLLADPALAPYFVARCVGGRTRRRARPAAKRVAGGGENTDAIRILRCSPASRSNEATLVGGRDRLGFLAHSELCHEMRKMSLYGSFTDDES